MLCLEVGQILLILRILRRLLVLCQFGIILFFCSLRLAFEDVSDLGGQDLPAFAHNLRNLSERQVLALEFLSNFYCLKVSDV